MDVPSQEVITRDNVSVKVNAVLYFRVLHPERAVIQVEKGRVLRIAKIHPACPAPGSLPGHLEIRATSPTPSRPSSTTAELVH